MDKADISWLLVSTLLVLMMAVPGLALFYGGLVRAKNMLSVLMQVMMIAAVVMIVWVVYGYTMAFGDGGNAFISGFGKMFLAGVTPDSVSATFSDEVIPEYVFIAFQMTFAAITPALIIGAFAERVKFSAVILFVVLWVTLVYFPVAHMVWAGSGLIFNWGALDFAGGTVVHINAGVAALVGCLMIGKRAGFPREMMAPHSMTLTMVGASLLWVGWFGFNAGSNLEANGVAAVAFVNTFVATAAAAVSWALCEQLRHGKPSLLGAVSGAVAGLVAITPASGFAHPMTAILLGFVVSPICLLFVSTIKNRLGYDDTLDVFGIHGVGGIVGAIATGIVADPALGGQGFFDYTQFPAVVGSYDMATQVVTQLKAVGITLLWSGIGSALLFLVIDKTLGLRPTADEEREGLDLAEHGERAYNY